MSHQLVSYPDAYALPRGFVIAALACCSWITVFAIVNIFLPATVFSG